MDARFAIETVNLTKRFPKPKRYRDLVFRPFTTEETTALDNISIRVSKGEIIGLLGPNGSGKTTLLKILSALVFPTEGRALVNGRDVVRQEMQIKKDIGFVISDERSFYWRLTGKQNLRFFAVLNNIPHASIASRISRLVNLVGLEKDINTPFHHYSSGTKQKLAIARGLLAEPKILLLDEPTRNLDSIIAQKLRRFIKEVICQEMKKTVFIATNNLLEAEELCDHIAVIQNGQMKFDGTLKAIKELLPAKQRYVLGLRGWTEDFEKIYQSSPLKQNMVKLNDPSHSNEVMTVRLDLNQQGECLADAFKLLVMSGLKIVSCHQEKRSLNDILETVLTE
jgi:ABC-2 type transport system ATP-binding protein